MRVTPECETLNSLNICNRADGQFGAAPVFDGENYIVIWSDRRFTGTYWWTTAARVTPQGVVLDTGNVIGNGTAHDEFYPDIAFDGNRCLAVWYHSYYPPYGIYGRFINHSAQPVDSVITIGSALSHFNNFPKVEYGVNSYLVVWADQRPGNTDYDIYGQIILNSGTLIGNRITIGTGEMDQLRPDIAYNGQCYIVVWDQEGKIFGQNIGLDGSLMGPSFAISDTIGDIRSCPRICFGDTSQLVVWSEITGAYSDIYGNISTGSGLEDEPGKPIEQNRNGMVTIITSQRYLSLSKGIKIFNSLGKRTDQSRMSTGLYFIELNGRITKKVVIKK